MTRGLLVLLALFWTLLLGVPVGHANLHSHGDHAAHAGHTTVGDARPSAQDFAVALPKPDATVSEATSDSARNPADGMPCHRDMRQSGCCCVGIGVALGGNGSDDDLRTRPTRYRPLAEATPTSRSLRPPVPPPRG